MTHMSNSGLRIVVVGAGYVGLTTSACLAQLGHRVTCIDINQVKIAEIRSGIMPIYEEGLPQIVQSGQESGRLDFGTDLVGAVEKSDFVFLCLPTPSDRDGFADLYAIKQVAAQLKGRLRPGTIVVNKSTVPVNSAHLVRELIGDDGIDVVSNPEFLREGSAVHDFLNPTRIVIGSDNPMAGERVGALYTGLRSPVIVTDPVSAESIKYMANAFLAMKISFVNQAADYCDAVGANVTEVMRGLSFDPRIGSTFLSPGPGWGGSCFPKDTQALVASAKVVGRPMTLVEEAMRANVSHINRITSLIHSAAISIQGKEAKISILGLSFKAGTDDVRDSPALTILTLLRQTFSNIVCYDPLAQMSDAETFIRAESVRDAISGAHVVAILTEWPEFSQVKPEEFAQLMTGNTIIDARYILDSDEFRSFGLVVRSLGKA
jgi:UDPglucose 6-dehydrogenase